jgi:hypothetical protein
MIALGVRDIYTLAMASRYLWMPSKNVFESLSVLLELAWSDDGLSKEFGHSDFSKAVCMRGKDVNDALSYMRQTCMITRTSRPRCYAGSPGYFVNWLVYNLARTMDAEKARYTPPDLICRRCREAFSFEQAHELVTPQSTLSCTVCSGEVVSGEGSRVGPVLGQNTLVQALFDQCLALVKARNTQESQLSLALPVQTDTLVAQVSFETATEEPVVTKGPLTWLGQTSKPALEQQHVKDLPTMPADLTKGNAIMAALRILDAQAGE